MLKADDLIPESSTNGNTEDWLKDLGSRRTPQVNLKPDPDSFDIDTFDLSPRRAKVKEEQVDDPMDVDDLPGSTMSPVSKCIVRFD